MNKEEIMKSINELPKIHNPISAMNSINIEDLYDAIDRFNKVPTYDELLKENKRLKDNWNKIKEYIKSEGVSYLNFADERCFCNKKAAKYILNKMQELEGDRCE